MFGNFEARIIPVSLRNPPEIMRDLVDHILELMEKYRRYEKYFEIFKNYLSIGVTIHDTRDIILVYGEGIPEEYKIEMLVHEIGHLIIDKIKGDEEYIKDLADVLEGFNRECKIKLALEMEFGEIYEKLGKSEILPNVFVKRKEVLRNMFYGRRIAVRNLRMGKLPIKKFSIGRIKEHLLLSLRSYIGTFLEKLDYKEISYKIREIRKNVRRNPPDFYIKMEEANLIAYLDKRIYSSLCTVIETLYEWAPVDREIWKGKKKIKFYDLWRIPKLPEDIFIVKVPYKKLLKIYQK